MEAVYTATTEEDRCQEKALLKIVLSLDKVANPHRLVAKAATEAWKIIENASQIRDTPRAISSSTLLAQKRKEEESRKGIIKTQKEN